MPTVGRGVRHDVDQDVRVRPGPAGQRVSFREHGDVGTGHEVVGEFDHLTGAERTAAMQLAAEAAHYRLG
ncbi:hypothetical protein [Phytoactinopolyspora halophila]|uniref:hypothetical protein n=1 Tax=Phytoactinopolyspora halophila TaxID=1981511 RepID=UPI001FE48D53|nr:hypothetical protein [Phytoactinopolyspora halophila]